MQTNLMLHFCSMAKQRKPFSINIDEEMEMQTN